MSSANLFTALAGATSAFQAALVLVAFVRVVNTLTPSAAERALWLPVVTLMFVTSLHVARRRATAVQARAE